MYYAGQAVTGASYSLDARLTYHFTPNWLLSGFVNANNTRNYSAETIGLTVRYLFNQPQASDVSMPLASDWRNLSPIAAP